jgi:hypothetical protein
MKINKNRAIAQVKLEPLKQLQIINQDQFLINN